MPMSVIVDVGACFSGNFICYDVDECIPVCYGMTSMCSLPHSGQAGHTWVPGIPPTCLRRVLTRSGGGHGSGRRDTGRPWPWTWWAPCGRLNDVILGQGGYGDALAFLLPVRLENNFSLGIYVEFDCSKKQFLRRELERFSFMPKHCYS